VVGEGKERTAFVVGQVAAMELEEAPAVWKSGTRTSPNPRMDQGLGLVTSELYMLSVLVVVAAGAGDSDVAWVAAVKVAGTWGSTIPVAVSVEEVLNSYFLEYS